LGLAPSQNIGDYSRKRQSTIRKMEAKEVKIIKNSI
jgi:hypothetical protein